MAKHVGWALSHGFRKQNEHLILGLRANGQFITQQPTKTRRLQWLMVQRGCEKCGEGMVGVIPLIRGANEARERIYLLKIMFSLPVCIIN